MTMDADRISNLHRDITDVILSCLSLRDAVRTSILSRDWRYKWTTIPSLVFKTNNCCPSSPKELVRTKLISVINQVLLLHTGSIHVFKADNFFSPLDIEPWILRLSQSSIKELELNLCNKNDEFPCSLYTCDTLVRLDLSDCVLKPPPPDFKGFMSLKNLCLHCVALTEDAFESLISRCPLLENLTGRMVDRGPKHIKINAPKLKNLRISGLLETVTFGDTHPKLSVVSIELGNCLLHKNAEGYLTQFFIKLPNIHTLSVKGDILRYWCAGLIPKRLPTPCFSLNTLTIGLDLSKMRESLTLVCIIRSSPNLTMLSIDVGPNSLEHSFGPRSKWLDEDKFSCALDKLRIVVLWSNCGSREELDFIKFVLMNSPALEKMYISSREQAYRDLVARRMSSFRKASTRAYIVLDTW